MFSLRTTLRSRPLTSSTSLLSSSSLPSLTLSSPSPSSHQTRGIKFEPKSHRTRKTQKGRVPIRTGGSTTGTVLTNGADYGVRVKQGLRITAKQLQACYAMLRLKMKPYKGTDIFMNVFPDRPICVKGNETRMGKGKGTFEYWAVNVPLHHTLFEIRGGGARIEIVRDAFRAVASKLPCGLEFMTSKTGPKRGYELLPLPEKHVPSPTMEETALALKTARERLQDPSVLPRQSRPKTLEEKEEELFRKIRETPLPEGSLVVRLEDGHNLFEPIGRRLSGKGVTGPNGVRPRKELPSDAERSSQQPPLNGIMAVIASARGAGQERILAETI